MKRTVIALLLCTALCAAVFAQKASNFMTDGKGTITTYLMTWPDTNTVIVIPAQIGGVTITAIGEGAFSGQGLTSVTIPNSVTTIGAGAFSSNSLTSVTIPNSVTSIGKGAFSENSNLTAINVAEGNTVYSSQNGVLYNKAKSVLVSWPAKKTPVSIPSSVTSIGDGAFSANGLTSVTIPNRRKTARFT
ncbi:leucine-rich repeat domain-containing protein [Treponema sp. R80B11-R83G3]